MRKFRLRWALTGTALLLLAGVGVGFWFLRPAYHPAQRTVPLTSYPGQQIMPALSPDGKQVAFTLDGEKGDNFDIYVKLVDTGLPLRLTTNPAPDQAPAWSPDGRYIAFLRYSGFVAEILMIPSLGGPERKLGQVGRAADYYIDYPYSLSWSPDGNFIAVADRAPNGSANMYLLAIQSGEKHQLTSPAPEGNGDFHPRFSPDGKSLAFVRSPSWASDDIYVVSIAGGEPRRVTSAQTLMPGLDWTSDGRNIVFSGYASGGFALWMVPAQGGQPVRLSGAGENGAAPSVSRQGNRLVYQRAVRDSNIWRMPGPNSSNRRAAPEKWIASTEADQEAQFSPDGKKIVFSSARSGSYELWTCDSNGRNPVELTSLGGPPAGSPRWSPDSRWIAFDAPKAGKADIFVIGAEGGVPRLLTPETSNNVRPSWSTDGRWIYFSSNRSGEWQVWKAPAQGGGAVQVTRRGGYEAFESPDGRFVYYSKEFQSTGIWKVAVGGGEETQVLEKAETAIFAMARGGICFFDWKDALHPVMQFYSVLNQRSTVLYEFPRGTNLDTGNTGISVCPDGQWILYTQIDQTGSNLVLVDNYR